jgi:hypothetical protein
MQRTSRLAAWIDNERSRCAKISQQKNITAE